MLDLIVACTLNNIQKVEIQNWPGTPWYEKWGWVSSICALGVLIIGSIIESRRTRKEYARSVRPFVSAASAALPSGTTVDVIGFQVANAPTRIVSLSVEISAGKDLIHPYKRGNFVRFPSTEWSYNHNDSNFSKALEEAIKNRSKLVRKIVIKYSPLDTKKQYFFELEQKFNPDNSRWDDTHSHAN